MNGVWTKICEESDLVAGSGVCALLEKDGSEEQVALFQEGADGAVYALSNYDPVGEAFVLSRGIIGSIGEKLVVASPLYKQHFCLESGQCIEDEGVRVKAWPARIDAGQVQIRVG